MHGCSFYVRSHLALFLLSHVVRRSSTNLDGDGGAADDDETRVEVFVYPKKESDGLMYVCCMYAVCMMYVCCMYDVCMLYVCMLYVCCMYVCCMYAVCMLYVCCM